MNEDNLVICDQATIIRDWGCVFARLRYPIALVADVDDNDYFDAKGAPTYWATLTYWRHDCIEGPSREIWLDSGDWGMSLTGDPAKRHLDLLNLERFLLERNMPWAEPVDPLHEIIRAARLLPLCEAAYTRNDQAVVFHAWLSRIRDLAIALFEDDVEAVEFTDVFDAATARLGDRAAALTTMSHWSTPTLGAPTPPGFDDASTWSPNDQPTDTNTEEEDDR
ncbi:hypothetical protein K3N28_05830 [Glycomyces sp. TRM65418]|uniref:hypothetical protein n=1 Tax=Glycomyces sp. TRM65418 TaxID=2867006 RepID=UPI001CE67066|nr:hypothetical protein [Glycomyces sp. TRM65418]MCC3762588.1 hypothetical protein [Glycomyces sp. TRM65418]QZD56627.1 hypothetical protein K3N28_05790 [Glycomyces sp. TRM65418]